MIYTAHDRNISAETMTFKILVCFQKEVIIKIDNWHLITNSWNVEHQDHNHQIFDLNIPQTIIAMWTNRFKIRINLNNIDRIITWLCPDYLAWLYYNQMLETVDCTLQYCNCFCLELLWILSMLSISFHHISWDIHCLSLSIHLNSSRAVGWGQSYKISQPVVVLF